MVDSSCVLLNRRRTATTMSSASSSPPAPMPAAKGRLELGELPDANGGSVAVSAVEADADDEGIGLDDVSKAVLGDGGLVAVTAAVVAAKVACVADEDV